MFGIDRTPNTEQNRFMDAAQLLVEAFDHLAIEVRFDRSDSATDLVIEPSGLRVEVKYRSLVADDTATALARDWRPESSIVLVVVADRVTRSAREILTRAGIGYCDLRGHIAVRSTGLVIDADFPAMNELSQRQDPLSGRAGLEVGAELLLIAESGASVREVARRTGRAPSTVSAILTGLRDQALVDAKHRVLDAQLFWRVADRWPATRTLLMTVPARDPLDADARALRLGLESPKATVGWALTDTRAALAYGAPVAATSNQTFDFYVPDQAIQRRARTLLGSASGANEARCAVRVAPVPAVCSRRIEGASTASGWPLAHPVFVALDLAKDAGRGREILESWTPPEPWARVW